MKHLQHFLAFIFISMALAYLGSCGDNRSRSGETSEDSLMIQYRILMDSVEQNWLVMIADDDDKHLLMKRLLLEVSYTNNYDKQKFTELNTLVDQLKEIRYDQRTMRSSPLIDAYDSATFDVSDRVILFARSHPRFADYPLMNELIEDINAKNNYILIHRIHYDSWVKKLNSFKERNEKKLLNADPPVGMEALPLFQLPS